MFRRLRVRSAMILCGLLMTAAAPAGADVTLGAPALAEIGQPFVVTVEVAGEEISDLRLSWQGHESLLSPEETEGGQRYSVLTGTDLKNARPGQNPLTVSFSAGGKREKIEHLIKLSPRKYPVEKLTVAPSKVTPPKELSERIAREAKLGRAAMQSNSAGGAPKLPLVRPVPGGFSSVYGKSRYFNGEFRGRHGGVDMRAKEGTPVKAAADGIVVLAGNNFWFAGNCVYLDHGAGLVTFYGHMSKVNVKKGDRIKVGDILGLSGRTGRVTGPHLHFSAAWRGEFFDPAGLMED